MGKHSRKYWVEGVLKTLNRVRILHQVITMIFELNLKNPSLSRLKIDNVKSEVTKWY